MVERPMRYKAKWKLGQKKPRPKRVPKSIEGSIVSFREDLRPSADLRKSFWNVLGQGG
jgi:hypothetical protein